MLPVSVRCSAEEPTAGVRRVDALVSAVGESNSPEEGSREPRLQGSTALFLWRGRRSNASGRDTAVFLSIGVNGHEEPQVRNLAGLRTLMQDSTFFFQAICCFYFSRQNSRFIFMIKFMCKSPPQKNQNFFTKQIHCEYCKVCGMACPLLVASFAAIKTLITLHTTLLRLHPSQQAFWLLLPLCLLTVVLCVFEGGGSSGERATLLLAAFLWRHGHS